MRRPTILEYARLSEASYGDNCPEGWLVAQSYRDGSTGCHAVAFRAKETDNVVIAYRGTTNFRDLCSDVEALLAREPSVFLAAFGFYARVRHFLSKRTFLGLTGHSLGGALAAFVAFYARHTHVDDNAEAHVFDALPIGELLRKYYPEAQQSGEYVTNYDDQSDVVSHLFGRKQFGTTYYVHEPVVYQSEGIIARLMEKADVLAHHSIGHLIEGLQDTHDTAL